MDSENDKKRLDLAVDRLSNLPDDLIHKILSFNDTIDAIKTSHLSSRWRYIWTTMPCLDVTTEYFLTLPMCSKFVKHVLSVRDDQREMSSVKLSFRGKASQVFVKKILKYAFAHSVQELSITCLTKDCIEVPLTLFSSQSLKHLTFKKANGIINFTSVWDLPNLTTLCLDQIRLSGENLDKLSGLISMCVNLKNLSLCDCQMMGLMDVDFNICHPNLSSLTIDPVPVNAMLSVVAPQLKNLSIKRISNRVLISAPDLAYMLLQCYNCLNFSADDFRSLEKVDVCISKPFKEDPRRIVCFLQRLHSVKFLTLNMEILELLSKSVELISNQPSPFANLKILKIYPNLIYKHELPKENVDVASEVKRYMLDNSPGATFTMISRKEIIAEKNVILAKEFMLVLQVLLEKEKAAIRANMAQIGQGNAPMGSQIAKMDEEQNAQVENQLQNEENMAHINNSWKYLSEQIQQAREKTNIIMRRLSRIKKVLTELPASNRAEMLPCFSRLCAEANIVIRKITDCMKTLFYKKHSSLNAGFHEFATTLQSSS
nr:hypothetical protein [Tanacetum cinerariifolium]